jgi:DNA mismatch repair ATPase MutS
MKLKRKQSGKRALPKVAFKRASKKKAARYSRSLARLKRAHPRVQKAKKKKKKQPVRDELLERFESGKSIADYIDFSAGRFVQIP